MKKALALFAAGAVAGAYGGWELQSFMTADAIHWAQVQEQRAQAELKRVLATPPTPHACAEATRKAVEMSAQYVRGGTR